MNLFGRRNLHDVNIGWTKKLTGKVSVMLWYHDFALANEDDVPYNVNMTPFNDMPAGSRGLAGPFEQPLAAGRPGQRVGKPATGVPAEGHRPQAGDPRRT